MRPQDRQMTLAVPGASGNLKGRVSHPVSRRIVERSCIEGAALTRNFTRKVFGFLTRLQCRSSSGQEARQADERTAPRDAVPVYRVPDESQTAASSDYCSCGDLCTRKTRKTWRREPGLRCRGACLASTAGASGLPIPVLDRIVLSDAESGETQNQHEEPGDPVPLCDYFLPSEERLDRSPLDALLAGEAGAENR